MITFEDAMIQLLGYEERVNAQWQQTRIIAYTIACTVTEKDDRGDIYDMFPLPGDPTLEERQDAANQEYESLMAENRKMTEMVRQQMNIIKQNDVSK